jgi:hypothetical protein
MSILGSSWIARAVLIVALACLYTGAVQFNNQVLFAGSQIGAFRNWVFLPAGLKLLLLMLFGWRAALALSLSIATIVLSEVHTMPVIVGILIGAFGGLTPYLAFTLLSKLLRLTYPWTGMNFKDVVIISVLIGIIEALVQRVGLSLIGIESWDNLLKDSIIVAIGRIIGTFLFMGLALWVKGELEKHESFSLN